MLCLARQVSNSSNPLGTVHAKDGGRRTRKPDVDLDVLLAQAADLRQGPAALELLTSSRQMAETIGVLLTSRMTASGGQTGSNSMPVWTHARG